MIVLAAMLLCLLLTYFGMIFTDVLHRVLKATGSNVSETCRRYSGHPCCPIHILTVSEVLGL
jgi:hypothetical protein